MEYREYGRFGDKISQLGFGAMRLPQEEDRKIDMDRSIEIMRRTIDVWYDDVVVENGTAIIVKNILGLLIK